MPTIRRDYKDSLFCHLFGSPDQRRNALELYNALSGASFGDESDLELTTIEDMIYLGRKNDVSFLVGDEMVLCEHQSTHNPNMPLRGLHYFSRLYTKLAEQRKLDLYSSAQLRLPTPRYVVLYFGEAVKPARETMRLSDSFRAGPGDIEVTATFLNCNEGHNLLIMEACKALKGYSHLIALERGNRKCKGMHYREAVHAAIDQCIDDGLLVEYLEVHRAEVERMLFTIQDEERAMRIHEEAIEREARARGYDKGLAQGLAQGLEQGIEQGLEQGRRETLVKSIRALVDSASYDVTSAMDALQVPEVERELLSTLL